jgi:predicted RNA-binding protein associated with RNAse of E/G family
MFPGEPFAIVEPFNSEGISMGVYVDICLPLVRRRIDLFELYDMMLDLWFPPSGPFQELDWNEFEQARHEGLMSPENAETALQAMERLRLEISRGIFPGDYIRLG